MLPHIVPEREVSLVRDEYKLLQAENIPDEWSLDSNKNLKRVDSFWAEVFDIKTCAGERKFKVMPKVVKSFFSLQNLNADVERSLSDIKNTCTSERKLQKKLLWA